VTTGFAPSTPAAPAGDRIQFENVSKFYGEVLGVNRIGMQRKGYDADRVKRIAAAIRLLTRSGLNSSQALDRLAADYPGDSDVAYLIDYVKSARRGVVRTPPGRGADEESDAV